MKKIILLLAAVSATSLAMAQVRGGDNFYAQKWVVDLNFMGGVSMQSSTVDSKSQPNFTNIMNVQNGTMKMNAGVSYGADIEGGYFIGKGRHWGIGAGIMYQNSMTDATLDKYHIEYQANDSKGNIYRQLVTANGPVKESLTSSNINIPVVLKYKKRFTTKIGFTMDAGILYNIQNSNSYNTDASFNYEAIYAFSSKGTYYDNGTNPENTDWLITQAQYAKHTSGTVAHDFDSLHNNGYNVGLGIKPTNNTGKISYTTGSIGFLVRPSITIRLLDRVHLDVGAYYSYQTFQNKTVANYNLIQDMGTNYSSMLNTVKTVVNQTAGINIGLRYFIGTPKDSDFDGKFDE